MSDTANDPRVSFTTLYPRDLADAKVIGNEFREGVPVLVLLDDADEDTARRLVDFFSGLAYALRGTVVRITDRAYHLTPHGYLPGPQTGEQVAHRGRRLTVACRHLVTWEGKLYRPVFPTPREPLDRPRPWCCSICGEPLDKSARLAHDDRCTRCYTVIFARRRSELLGGGRT